MTRRVLYTAAHHGFNLDQVPLGGGAAVCARLVREWEATRPFPLTLLDPGLLGDRAPLEKDLVRFSELRYARFCREFEGAATGAILRHDPRTAVILSNDVAEGPDFPLLARRGYRIFTIYHVDVVDYFARIYLRGKVRPETLVRWFEAARRSVWGRWIPDVAVRLFQKQIDSVQHSAGLIVPSDAMKDVLMRFHPSVDPGKIHVIPWGIWEPDVDPAAAAARADTLREELRIPRGMKTLLTLSRISPEKGQDRLLRAVAQWEREPDYPKEGLCLILCGEAAYMQGQRFLRRLRRLARALKKTRVLFPGHVAGVEKEAYFRIADLYVFPSRHESYGLTLMEALRAGLPAVASNCYGTRELIKSDFGALLPQVPEAEFPETLVSALRHLLAKPERLKKMGAAAKSFARSRRFGDAAAAVARLLLKEYDVAPADRKRRPLGHNAVQGSPLGARGDDVY